MKTVVCPKCLKPSSSSTKTSNGWRYYCVPCNYAMQATDVIPRSYYEEKRK